MSKARKDEELREAFLGFVRGEVSQAELEAKGEEFDAEQFEEQLASEAEAYEQGKRDAFAARTAAADRPHSNSHSHATDEPAPSVAQTPEAARQRAKNAEVAFKEIEKFFPRESEEYRKAFGELQAAWNAINVPAGRQVDRAAVLEHAGNELENRRRTKIADEIRKEQQQELGRLARDVATTSDPVAKRDALSALIEFQQTVDDPAVMDAEVDKRMQPTRTPEVTLTQDGAIQRTYWAEKLVDEKGEALRKEFEELFGKGRK